MGSRHGYDCERYFGFTSWGKNKGQIGRPAPRPGFGFRADLGEIPALDEMSGHVSSRLPVDHRGDVVPGHSGSRVSVYEVWESRDR